MKLIKFNDYEIQLWKNGFGQTRLIAEDQKKMWRLSAATVKTESEFSEYKNCDRLLTVWQGDGLLLNNFILNKNEIYKFSGETKIHCKPLCDEIIDVGLIYDRANYRASMEVVEILNNQKINFKAGQHFLFCLDGAFNVSDYFIEHGDTLQFQTNINLELLIKSSHSKILVITIESKF